ncbi:MAG: RNA methyltransferase [Alphaproteobacteria bacterium]
MAGTDRKKPTHVEIDGPAIVLVRPQLGVNIGAAARAMLNCGLTDLRLVEPREGWPNDYAVKAASGADPVLDKARLYDSTPDSVADLDWVIATTARQRARAKRIYTPQSAAVEMRRRVAEGQKVGILFGAEKSGLHNDDVSISNAVLTVPLNPSFSSLNLAQAVLLVGFQYFSEADETPEVHISTGDTRPANHDELMNFFTRLEDKLDAHGFFRTRELKPTVVRNLRAMFARAELTEQEIRTLHGIVAALSEFPHKPRQKADTEE